MKSYKSRGFTLIELVVVITILGILAAFAIPRFVALDSQARIATVNGLAGSVKSAASLARALSMATGNAAGPVAMEGASGLGVTLINNYPDGTASGIANAVNSNSADFTFAAASGGNPATWSKVGAPTPTACQVQYTPPAAAGTTPTVAVVNGGC
jgi:MSHA pilin protein MshA